MDRSTPGLLLLILLTTPAFAQVETARLLASDGGADHHFAEVAIDGDTLIVGAPEASHAAEGSGAAYVFELTRQGWVETALLLPEDGVEYGGFGRQVLLEGNRAVISAPFADSATSGAGALYVYERSAPGENWELAVRLTALDGFEFDAFGTVLAMSGDRIIAGALNDDDAGKSSGAAYVYEKFGPLWLQTAKLVAADADEFDRFGSSVSIDGDNVVVGAPGDNGGAPGSGSVYFFRRTATGWVSAEKILSPEPNFISSFGSSVALAGDTVMIGETGHDEAGSNSGAVHAFRRVNGVWERTQKLFSSQPEFIGQFGESLALDQNRLLVGAPRETGDASQSGVAYLFESDGENWQMTERLQSGQAGTTDFFGSTLAVAGDRLVVGAPFEDGQAANSGVVHVYEPVELSVPFCFCAAESPCGNLDADGGCTNSTLSGARLSSSGSTSVGADDLVLHVSSIPADQSAVVFMGAGRTSLPLGDGWRCVDWGNVGMFRFPLRNAGAVGAVAEGPGMAAHSAASFGSLGTIRAGQTWYAQVLFRDNRGFCGEGVNLSNALALTFVP